MASNDYDGKPKPAYRLSTWAVLGGAVIGVTLLFWVRGPLGPNTSRAYPPRPQPPDAAPVLLTGPGPSEEYFPCSDCHDPGDYDPTPRELTEEHDTLAFDHGKGRLWCLACHDADQRDFLHLADGTRISFQESWKLCTQCHVKKLADWKAGVHGKRTGHWRGPKEFRTCVLCHDPHSPRFKPLKPKPPPVPPARIVWRSRRAGEEASNGAH